MPSVLPSSLLNLLCSRRLTIEGLAHPPATDQNQLRLVQGAGAGGKPGIIPEELLGVRRRPILLPRFVTGWTKHFRGNLQLVVVVKINGFPRLGETQANTRAASSVRYLVKSRSLS